MKINWTLQPKQLIAQQCPAREMLYGGAAGGGKTDLLLFEGLETALIIPGSKGIIFRRTYPELEQEIIPRSKQKFVFEDGTRIGTYLAAQRCWTFPNNSILFFRHAQHESDIENYQGGEYDFVGFDELTKFTKYQYDYMKSRARSTIPGSIPKIRASSNPGGVGHGWVKVYFNVNDKSMRIHIDPETGLSKCFIPSRLYDNKILMGKDPLYEKNLMSLPPKLRKALLDGNWDVFSGQVFEEWVNNPNPLNQYTHVVKPFKIPREWRRYRTFDFGYARPFSVAWWAIDYDGKAYRYRELYGYTGEPNVGVKWHPQRIAEKILEIEMKYEQDLHKIIGIADPSIWDASRGESIGRQMEKAGVFFEPGDNKRIPGKMQLHYRFSFDDEGYPMLYVFENCKQFIRTIPDLVYDDHDPEDIDTEGEDHIYDETRYFLMMNPISPRINIPAKAVQFNPLEEDAPIARYGFMRV